MSVPYNCTVVCSGYLPVGNTTMKTYLQKDPNTTTDTNRNLFFLYLWLHSIEGLDTIDVFFERDISTSDNVAQKLPL